MEQREVSSSTAVEMERYAVMRTWADELGIDHTTLSRKLRSAEGIPGLDRLSRLQIFYAESVVRAATLQLFLDIPTANDAGFILRETEAGPVKHGTAQAWGRELGISPTTVGKKMAGTSGITGKDSGGHVHEGRYYAEADVRMHCANVLGHRVHTEAEPDLLPKADEKGFFLQEGERYGTAVAWSAELGLSETAIRKVFAGQIGVEGRTRKNSKHLFYPESIIRERLSHLLVDVPQADATNFIIMDGVRHGTIGIWANELGIDFGTIKKRLGAAKGITGKGRGGQLYADAFYPEPIVRAACADLLPPTA